MNQTEELSIKELLLRDFGVDLPISGGSGNSIGNAVQILEADSFNLASIELTYLQCLGIGRRIRWTLLRQDFLEERDRAFNKLKIETVEETPTDVITQIENYYFDITDCQNNLQPLPETIYGITTPSVIAGYLLKYVEDNEISQAGLGYSLYYGKPGWKATVYIYTRDLSPTDPPKSPREAVVQEHFGQVVDELSQLVEHGVGQNSKVKDVYGTASAATGKEFLCAELQIQRQDELLDSYTFLTVHDGRYFKIRMTSDHSENSVNEAFEFMNAWAALLQEI